LPPNADPIFEVDQFPPKVEEIKKAFVKVKNIKKPKTKVLYLFFINLYYNLINNRKLKRWMEKRTQPLIKQVLQKQMERINRKIKIRKNKIAILFQLRLRMSI
jgi:hypothetical protein